jgi:protein-arginine kinase activator protein McsA
MNKKCYKCGIIKGLHEFNKDKSRSDGISYICRTCIKISRKNKDYKYRNNSDYKEKHKYRHMKNRYGITKNQWEEMYMKHLGMCALCHEPFGDLIPQVDHCHTTNKIRGLLHPSCNRCLGIFKDNINKFNFAIEYLEKNKI